jgi:cystathionine beta-lyase family protein involved in aluminum resistance
MNPAQQRQQMQQLDDTITENLEKVIVNVMGSSDPIKRRQFVSQMHAQDTATVREWLRDNTPGIDNSVIVGCPDCNTEHTVELPITEAFFRPSKPAGV